MPELFTVRVPDIGDFEDVEVVELLVSPGDTLAVDDPILVLESDKASMEVPAPVAGRVERLLVRVGDQVSEGAPICSIEPAGDAPPAGAPDTPPEPSAPAAPEPAEKDTAPAPTAGESARGPSPRVEAGTQGQQTQVLVLGGGPGGYTAAFRAADLGKRVALVEREPVLGGVCLRVGCIPSKVLLHMAAVLEEARALADHGIRFGEPHLELDRIRARKQEVVDTLTRGLDGLADRRRIELLRGEGRFVGTHEVAVSGPEGTRRVRFEQAIVAVGSRSVEIPGLPDDPRVMDSTDALELPALPGRLLVVGGGIIGLEMATVYAAFGSRVCVVELLDDLMAGTDRDLVRPLERRLRERLEAIWLGTRVAGVEALAEGLRVRFTGGKAPEAETFDRVLVAVGRRPNGDRIGAEAAGLQVDERGFLPVDAQRRTQLPHIYAIGDLTGPPMLAHKAAHEGRVAAEVIAGLPASFDARAIPSVAYTDPEVAWTGISEEAARAEGRAVRKGVFPWSANGRALGMGRGEGLTKLLFSEADGVLVGAGVVGAHAGELIAEATLAIEMGADAEDLGLTIHPHPSLSETVGLAAEMAAGTITDLLPPRG